MENLFKFYRLFQEYEEVVGLTLTLHMGTDGSGEIEDTMERTLAEFVSIEDGIDTLYGRIAAHPVRL